MTDSGACDRCLTRTWLLARLAGHLEQVRARIDHVLELCDRELIAALAGGERVEVHHQFLGLDVEQARGSADRAGVTLVCRCTPAYPRRLRSLASPPAVLHVAGDFDRFLSLAGGDPVAIVGARRASPYGLEVARSLGRALARAGLTIVSGMALGIDSAAHAGALEADAPTVAVLPGAADTPYPAAKRMLHRRIVSTGAAVSELPPGTGVRRWMFPARNRIIAGLAAMTLVVEAGERSGALLTAASAQAMGRAVGAVPGRVTAPQAAGPNGLLAQGAVVVRGAQDVLDHLFGSGARQAAGEGRPQPVPELKPLLRAVADGHDTPAALARAGFAPERLLADLASLELGGHLRRAPGGRFEIVP